MAWEEGYIVACTVEPRAFSIADSNVHQRSQHLLPDESSETSGTAPPRYMFLEWNVIIPLIAKQFQ